jgi:hypothetical protein
MRDFDIVMHGRLRHAENNRDCHERDGSIQMLTCPVTWIEGSMLTKRRYVSDPDFTFDVLRGLAQYTGSGLIGALAEAVIRHPYHNISQALGHRQIACKTWLRDELLKTLGGEFGTIWMVGGWYGVLPAILFDDPRFEIGKIISFDMDPDCAAVALTLNRVPVMQGRFEARTADMYALDYEAPSRPDLVINTSCEHIADLRGWLDLLPAGMPVVLQSNDYFSDPEHINCVRSLEEFEIQANLSKVAFHGTLGMTKYSRFMLIGYR